MKSKQIITVLLLAFVGVSVVVLVVKQTARGPIEAENTAEAIAADSDLPAHHVVVYYFHNEIRCYTCLKIEEYAHEAIEKGFERDLEEKNLIWRKVNRELPENGHFNQEYQLVTSSVVLVNMQDGHQTEWKDLVHVWEPDLLDDKEEFFQYVQDEVKFYLEGD